MNVPANSPDDLASLLATARATGTQVTTPPSAASPPDAAAAYSTQHLILERLGQAAGGWKIGSKSPDGPIQGAPLPHGAVRRHPGSVRRAAHPVLGLELELAFRLGRPFEPGRTHADGEVEGAIAAVAAAIEVVSCRFADWPNIDKLLQLADLQNHGALIVGEEVPYQAAYPFTRPTARFEFAGRSVFDGDARNPAGDPRRLLPWVVNHATRRGLSITPDMWLTTGSYTGMHFPVGVGLAVGAFDGLPELRLAVE